MITRVQHKIYGPISVLTGDQSVSKYLLDEETVWEQHVVDFFKKYYVPGTNIVDVGAFLGFHTVYIANHVVSNGGRVYAIESQPDIYKVLQMNTSTFPNVTTVWGAASHTNGYIRIGVPRDYETFPNPGGCGVVDSEFSHPELTTMEVPSLTLDSLDLKNVSLVKLDVEGHEMEALAGALSFLRENRPVLIVELCGGRDRLEHKDEIDRRIAKICSYGYRLAETHADDYAFVPTTPSECPLDDSLLSQQARF